MVHSCVILFFIFLFRTPYTIETHFAFGVAGEDYVMADKIKIVVTKRSDDFHASIEGHPEIWGCHPTLSDAAIGDLIRSHAHIFGIEVAWNEDSWTKRYLAHDPLTRR